MSNLFREEVPIVNLSGRGDKDIFQVAARLEEEERTVDGVLKPLSPAQTLAA